MRATINSQRDSECRGVSLLKACSYLLTVVINYLSKVPCNRTAAIKEYLGPTNQGTNVTTLSQQTPRDRLLELAGFLNREMHIGSLEAWLSLDLTILQIKTLLLLDHLGSMRMGQISRLLGSTVSATTSIVERLFERNLVDREDDPADRRVVLIKLTTEGREAVNELWAFGRDRIDAVCDNLNDDELRSLISAFEILRRAVDEGYRKSE